MGLIIVGINHKSAPLSVREQLAFVPDMLPAALQSLAAHPGIDEALILSTCNRTELYCNASVGETVLRDWLAAHRTLSSAILNPHLYTHQADAAVQHAMRVAAGLDSMVLGEPQILGQLKAAFAAADAAGTVDTALRRLFETVFAVSKKVRTESAIGQCPVSVAYCGVKLAKQWFDDLAQTRALLIGAGESIELVAQHLHRQGCRALSFANRTPSRLHTLANSFDGTVHDLTALPSLLTQVDVVISATASPEPLLTQAMVSAALPARGERPLFLLDLAVPRDIESEVGHLAGVCLYNIDDLERQIADNKQQRASAAALADSMIDDHVRHFMQCLASLDMAHTIRDYREKAHTHCQAAIAQALQQLDKGADAQDVVAVMAKQLTNKLIHRPTEQLRQAGYSGDTDLIHRLEPLFDLSEDTV